MSFCILLKKICINDNKQLLDVIIHARKTWIRIWNIHGFKHFKHLSHEIDW